jgi:hypothetical protein
MNRASAASSIVTSDLQLYLDASNTLSYPGSGTTWTDLSGNSRNGTLTNGVSFSSSNGGVLVLDGVNDYISFSIGSLKSSFGSSISVSTWVKYTNISGGCIFGDWNVSGYGETGRLQLNGYQNVAGKIGGYLDNSTGNISSTTTIAQNVWYNYSITYDGTVGKLYLNGVLETQKNYIPTGVGTGNFSIGRGGDYNGLYASINMSNFLIYNKSLTSSEVLQNFNATKSKFGL